MRHKLDDRQGEDARTQIVRCQETRRQSENRADPRATAPAGDLAGPLLYWTGCPAFSPELRRVTWPQPFRPILTDKYNRKFNRKEFLNVYPTAVIAARGDEKVLANWFPLALEPNVRLWLMHLPENSIQSWNELCDQFVRAFQGGYKHPRIVSDLHLLV